MRIWEYVTAVERDLKASQFLLLKRVGDIKSIGPGLLLSPKVVRK